MLNDCSAFCFSDIHLIGIVDIDFFYFFSGDNEGKEGTKGTKSIGEASSLSERPHCEKANSRHA